MSSSTDLPDLPRERMPRHIAIIMDGNGRWAQQRGLPRVEGHRRGAVSVRRTTEECARLGLPVGPENLGLRPATDDRVPMACGTGAECAAMPGVCDPEENGAI